MKLELLKYAIIACCSLLAAFVLSTIIHKILNKIVRNYSDKLKADPTNFSFINNSVSFIIYSLAILFIFIKIPFLKQMGTALFAGAGVLAAIIGFASQKAFSNIISGVFILIFKPFRVDDAIQISGGKTGVVEEITLRHTTLRDYQNQRIIVPNSVISEDTITNSHLIDERINKHIEIDISIDSDIDTAIAIIQEEVLKHPLFMDGRTNEDIKHNEPLVIVRLIAITDYSLKLRANVWANNNAEGFIIKCDLLRSLKYHFDKKGIKIAQRTAPV